MFLRIGYELQFDLVSPTHMLLLLHTHPQHAAALQRPEVITTDPQHRIDAFIDPFGNRAARLQASAGKLRVTYDNVVADSGELEPRIDGQRIHPIDELPNDVLPYLLASRYCEVDRVLPFAWDLFGKTPPMSDRVQAVMDWVKANVTFGYKFARVNKTAYDVWYERKGVCRDFQHLAIAAASRTEHPGEVRHGIFRGHRRSTGRTCRWIFPPGWKSSWAAAGGRSTRDTTNQE